jgi:hypothetical protein
MSAVESNHHEDDVDHAYDRLLSQLNEKNVGADLERVPNYRTTNLVNKIIASIRPVPCKFAQGLMP